MAKQPVRVVQIIARMNVGGPAVIVADLMRSLDKTAVEQTLITGYCDENEADYLETVATAYGRCTCILRTRWNVA